MPHSPSTHAEIHQHVSEIVELLSPNLDIHSGIYPHVRAVDHLSRELELPILRLDERPRLSADVAAKLPMDCTGLYLAFWFPDCPDSYGLVIREPRRPVPKNTFVADFNSSDPANVRRFLNAMEQWEKRMANNKDSTCDTHACNGPLYATDSDLWPSAIRESLVFDWPKVPRNIFEFLWGKELPTTFEQMRHAGLFTTSTIKDESIKKNCERLESLLIETDYELQIKSSRREVRLTAKNQLL